MSQLDPDRLAELEREQSFLLRSLDDLDDELAAGDLDVDDHRRLEDDYTRRLAEVTRSIDERRTAFADVDHSLSSRQRTLTIVGVVVLAVLAGVLLARASGFRSPADSVTGDIRQSSTGLLAEADTLTREGRWPEAIEVYDEVLDIAPSNTEALTYRAWMQAQLGEPEQGLVGLGEAIAIDPTYPDARVFRAILLDDAQRFDEAAADLSALDDIEVPVQIEGLVNGSGLRGSIAAGQIVTRFGGSNAPVDLDEVGVELDDAVAGGLVLIDLDTPLALRVFSAVLEKDPVNLTALVAAGNIQTNPAVVAESPKAAERGLGLLDRAVDIAPGDAQLRLSRASARTLVGDSAGAAADFAEISRAELPEPLWARYEELAELYG